MGKGKNVTLEPFDKYFHYRESVQGPENDVGYLSDTYKALRGRPASSMREDFCGTFAICCEWAKTQDDRVAYGIDLDPEPIAYGRQHYLSQLDSSAAERVHIREENVLSPDLKPVDLVCALNFSYFIFKERETLKQYFANVLKTLNDDGIFIVDCFGGSKCYEANEEETEYEDLGFSYYWDQDNFNPINNEAQFYIHFKRNGEKKREKVFAYDWRLWSIAELRDIMMEAGFSSTHVYWEGTDDDGEGDGEFTRTEMGEECESWVAYIAAAK